MNFKQYFAQLTDWKKLPAYKAEPRIDSLIGFYLQDILEDYFKTSITGIIPELPIRLGTVKPEHEHTNYAERSFKVDFFAVTDSDVYYLVEFKTDSGSRRDEQDTYLQEAKDVGVRAIMDGIEQIAKVSTYKKKYAHLLGKLNALQLLGDSGNAKRFEIIYVQPSNKSNEPNVIDFLWIADWLEAKHSADFEREFAKTLRIWAVD